MCFAKKYERLKRTGPLLWFCAQTAANMAARMESVEKGLGDVQEEMRMRAGSLERGMDKLQQGLEAIMERQQRQDAALEHVRAEAQTSAEDLRAELQSKAAQLRGEVQAAVRGEVQAAVRSEVHSVDSERADQRVRQQLRSDHVTDDVREEMAGRVSRLEGQLEHRLSEVCVNTHTAWTVQTRLSWLAGAQGLNGRGEGGGAGAGDVRAQGGCGIRGGCARRTTRQGGRDAAHRHARQHHRVAARGVGALRGHGRRRSEDGRAHGARTRPPQAAAPPPLLALSVACANAIIGMDGNGMTHSHS